VRLVVGRAYILKGMNPEMWDRGHPRYGKPSAIAAKYIGALHGARRWHGFEVWIAGKEVGVLFMNDADLERLEVTEI